MGLGCCWLGSIDKDSIKTILAIPENVQLLYMLAVGFPAESPESIDAASGDSLAYFLDEKNQLHVPKLAVDEIARWM